MSFTLAARAFSPVLGCAKSFVTFRETFVSRRAAETPRRGGFSCSARSAARLVNRRVHLPRNRRTVKILSRELPDTRVIILTSFAASEGIAHALHAGAAGALMKTDDVLSKIGAANRTEAVAIAIQKQLLKI